MRPIVILFPEALMVAVVVSVEYFPLVIGSSTIVDASGTRSVVVSIVVLVLLVVAVGSSVAPSTIVVSIVCAVGSGVLLSTISDDPVTKVVGGSVAIISAANSRRTKTNFI